MTWNHHSYFEDIGAWPRESRSFLRAYAVGFLLSILCTTAAFWLAIDAPLPRWQTVFFLFVLALAQLVVQLICFLHLGAARASRARLSALLFAVGIAAVIVIGSLWIMGSLGSRTMPDRDAMENYMSEQGGF